MVLVFSLKYKTSVLYFKSDYGHSISRLERRWFPKSTARLPIKERWHYPPNIGLPWDSPSPLPESVRVPDVRTLTSGPIGYQIALPMLPGSAAFGGKGAPLLCIFTPDFPSTGHRGTQRFVSGDICSEGLKSPEIFGFSCSES